MDNQITLSQAIISTLITLASGIAIFYFLFFALRQLMKKKKTFVTNLLDKHIHSAGILLFIFIITNIVFEKFKQFILTEHFSKISHLIEIMLIISIGIFIMKVAGFLKDFILHYYEKRKRIDYSLRSAKTKYQLLLRIVNVVILLCVVFAVLITFPQIRELGGALIASAGVAGIVIGFAAQKSLGSLFAGIQIALSQPIKIDDTIVVEGTFGTVGEITLTYVVINTWDEKRLIVPVNYFLEKPFENWTRNSPEVVSIVKVCADYTLPIVEVRAAFYGWIEKSKLWDKRKAALLITDADDKTIEVRATMSAKNSSDAFDLECYIREKLVTFINEKYPLSLPSARIKNNNINGVKTNPV